MNCDVFWTSLSQPLSEIEALPVLQLFPISELAKIQKLHFSADRDLAIAGKLLLAYALKYFNHDVLNINSLQREDNNKPFLKSNLKFNISHSGKIAVCAVACDYEIGIDIEQIQPLDINDFHNCFCAREWLDIISAPDLLSEFYRLWTRKEAFLKAIGIGITIPLNNLDCRYNINYGEQMWQILPLQLAPLYWSHLAIPHHDINIRCHYIDIYQLIK